jgi:hypothetical protein
LSIPARHVTTNCEAEPHDRRHYGSYALPALRNGREGRKIGCRWAGGGDGGDGGGGDGDGGGGDGDGGGGDGDGGGGDGGGEIVWAYFGSIRAIASSTIAFLGSISIVQAAKSRNRVRFAGCRVERRRIEIW